MTDRYKQLLEERARAKLVLDGSAVWIAWKAADAALRPSLETDDLDRLSAPLPVLMPEDVVGFTLADSFASWDEQDPLLLGYARVRRAEEIREQLVNSAEWLSFQEAQQQLLVFAKGELAKKKEAQQKGRSSLSRLSPQGDGLPPPPSHLPSSTAATMLLQAPMAAIDSSNSTSPPDTSSSALHVAALAASLLPDDQYSEREAPCASPQMDSSSRVGSPSRSTSMAADSAGTLRESSASHAPPPESPPITVAETSGSFASVSVSTLPSVGLSSSSSAAVIVTSGINVSSATENHSTGRTNRARHSIQSATSPPLNPQRSSPATLKRPSWCVGIVGEGNTVLGENQLGLVDQGVREICGSLRPQVQRIWSIPGRRSLLAALVTAQHFTPASWSHPTPQHMDDLRQRVHDGLEQWSDEQFAAVVIGYTRTEYSTKFLTASSQEPFDTSFVHLIQAVDPTYPSVYVISVDSHADAKQASLDIIGNQIGASTTTPCIVLYRHVSSDNHFEAVSWKPSRGGTPLITSFRRSHEFIAALEMWNQGRNGHSSSPSLTRKRRRTGEMIDLVQDEMTDDAAATTHNSADQTPPL
jgi:hypothetical protein